MRVSRRFAARAFNQMTARHTATINAETMASEARLAAGAISVIPAINRPRPGKKGATYQSHAHLSRDRCRDNSDTKYGRQASPNSAPTGRPRKRKTTTTKMLAAQISPAPALHTNVGKVNA